MDWLCIQPVAFLIISGSMALIALVLWRITCDLVKIRADMLSLLSNIRGSGSGGGPVGWGQRREEA
jgi:hypothetical protein